MASRRAVTARKTAETDIRVTLDLDGPGGLSGETPIGFFTHMLASFARHGGFALTVEIVGDIHIDDHHTIEDTALVLGRAFDEALGDRAGVRRFGQRLLPMDGTLARCAVDLSGRPWFAFDGRFEREAVGGLSTEMVPHFFRSFATAARLTLHLDLLRGDNDHHRIEALFKAFALALAEAVSPGRPGIPSTKEAL